MPFSVRLLKKDFTHLYTPPFQYIHLSILTVHTTAQVAFPVQIRLSVCDRGHENLSKVLPRTLLTDLTSEA